MSLCLFLESDARSTIFHEDGAARNESSLGYKGAHQSVVVVRIYPDIGTLLKSPIEAGLSDAPLLSVGSQSVNYPIRRIIQPRPVKDLLIGWFITYEEAEGADGLICLIHTDQALPSLTIFLNQFFPRISIDPL